MPSFRSMALTGVGGVQVELVGSSMSDYSDIILTISTMNTNMRTHDISPGGKCYQGPDFRFSRQRKRMRSPVTPPPIACSSVTGVDSIRVYHPAISLLGTP